MLELTGINSKVSGSGGGTQERYAGGILIGGAQVLVEVWLGLEGQ